jgi:uncharacterized protein (DUF1778 family)
MPPLSKPKVTLDNSTYCVHIVAMKRRKSDNERKDFVVRLRVTADQKEFLMKASEQVGLDLSNWIRFIALREAKSLLTSNT